MHDFTVECDAGQVVLDFLHIATNRGAGFRKSPRGCVTTLLYLPAVSLPQQSRSVSRRGRPRGVSHFVRAACNSADPPRLFVVDELDLHANDFRSTSDERVEHLRIEVAAAAFLKNLEAFFPRQCLFVGAFG